MKRHSLNINLYEHKTTLHASKFKSDSDEQHYRKVSNKYRSNGNARNSASNILNSKIGSFSKIKLDNINSKYEPIRGKYHGKLDYDKRLEKDDLFESKHGKGIEQRFHHPKLKNHTLLKKHEWPQAGSVAENFIGFGYK